MEKQIDPKALLDKLLGSSKALAEKGQAFAEEKLNIPESGAEREQMLDGMKKGAIASALLLGLLGTKGGRRLTGKAIKIGGLAALGTAAYKGYQRWQASKTDDSVTPIHELTESAAHDRALLLIETMVSAANADGKVDDQESALIKREILEMNLPQTLFDSVAGIIESPLTAQALADKVNDPETASEVYLAARLLIDEASGVSELAYMKELIEALKLDTALVAELDKQVSVNNA